MPILRMLKIQSIAFYLTLFALGTIACSVSAQPVKASRSLSNPAIWMDRYDGPSVKTDLGYGIILNKASSLRKEWFVLRDDSAPALLEGENGITIAFGTAELGGSNRYEYRLAHKLNSKEPLAAIELRVHVFDVFGKLIRTLSATSLVDVVDADFGTSVWRVPTENEAAAAFASVAYVAATRTASGRVYEIDRVAVLELLRRISRRITETDLDPKRGDSP